MFLCHSVSLLLKVLTDDKDLTEYLCVATKVPLAEISFCVLATPVIIHYADLDSLVTTPHPEIIPCSDQFPMIIETRKHAWVTVKRRVAKIAKPIQIHEKVSKIA